MVPQRKILRTEHLDASTAHVERAILARAEKLEELATTARSASAAGAEVRVTEVLTHEVALAIAEEFRNLAEEIHWW